MPEGSSDFPPCEPVGTFAREDPNPCRQHATIIRRDDEADATNTREKRSSPVKCACNQCRRRKTRCTGQRPICDYCKSRDLDCVWDAEKGLTRLDSVKTRFETAQARLYRLEQLIHAMRTGTDDESTTLLARLRLGDTIEEIVLDVSGKSMTR